MEAHVRRQRTLRAAAAVATTLSLGIAGIAYPHQAAAETTSVTIAGDLQSEIGCAGTAVEHRLRRR